MDWAAASTEDLLKNRDEEAPFIAKKPDEDLRVFKYAPKYKIAFSLLYQEPDLTVEAPDLRVPIARKRFVQQSLAFFLRHAAQVLIRSRTEHILPSLQPLESLHAFDVETHVQYHAPLSIALRRTSSEKLQANQTILSPDDLKAFVNQAQWSLGGRHSPLLPGFGMN